MRSEVFPGNKRPYAVPVVSLILFILAASLMWYALAPVTHEWVCYKATQDSPSCVIQVPASDPTGGPVFYTYPNGTTVLKSSLPQSQFSEPTLDNLNLAWGSMALFLVAVGVGFADVSARVGRNTKP
ncbi:MAG: hypothetical protein KGI26_04775 [Thaumarchaeota archaeon]|nr:hypothetical protein [Nitrososphaerota archaeon]